MKNLIFKKSVLFACALCFMCNNSNVNAQMKNSKSQFEFITKNTPRDNNKENTDLSDKSNRSNEEMNNGNKTARQNLQDVARIWDIYSKYQGVGPLDLAAKIELNEAKKKLDKYKNMAEKDTAFAKKYYLALTKVKNKKESEKEIKKKQRSKIVKKYNGLVRLSQQNQYKAKPSELEELKKQIVQSDGIITLLEKQIGDLDKALQDLENICEDCNAK